MRKFEFEILGMGMKDRDYAGSFTKPVRDIIKSHINGRTLHLYSGCSLLGDERIDIANNSATQNMSVLDFILNDKRNWDWVILDPPYNLSERTKQLLNYANACPLSVDVKARRLLKSYFQEHTDNILWLDICAPVIRGFYREMLWLLLPGGFHPVRVLSWLKREMKPLL